MNNKNGFTLVELIAVIALIAIIAVLVGVNVSKGGENAKKTLLNQKIESIENAAITYGQDNRDKFTTPCNSSGQICNGISNCYCYNETITVEKLLNEKVLNPDQDLTTIKNPVNDEDMKICQVQLYTKYGKIYATYDITYNKTTNKTICWY